MRQGKRPRLAYLSGPVDAAAVYDTWINGSQHNYFGTSYLSQFYQLCTELRPKAYVVTTLPGQYLRHQVGKRVNRKSTRAADVARAFLPHSCSLLVSSFNARLNSIQAESLNRYRSAKLLVPTNFSKLVGHKNPAVTSFDALAEIYDFASILAGIVAA